MDNSHFLDRKCSFGPMNLGVFLSCIFPWVFYLVEYVYLEVFVFLHVYEREIGMLSAVHGMKTDFDVDF